eukprot:TRINITY_DN4377_c1_g1_i1.p1 TRINITY_DN4377_c1_g1~~TRINITY_DN4377_c1_g1_i1.p1  ORF type:complete len:727 (-),score=157.99 TRINITY_DN4377_c1_g1_i1:382-2562(-)
MAFAGGVGGEPPVQSACRTADIWTEYLDGCRVESDRHVAAQMKMAEDLISRLRPQREASHAVAPNSAVDASERLWLQIPTVGKSGCEPELVTSDPVVPEAAPTLLSQRERAPLADRSASCKQLGMSMARPTVITDEDGVLSPEPASPGRSVKFQDADSPKSLVERRRRRLGTNMSSCSETSGTMVRSDSVSSRELQTATIGFAHRTELHLEHSYTHDAMYKTMKMALGTESTFSRKLSDHFREKALKVAEPPEGRLAWFVRSRYFQALSISVIVVNTWYIIAALDASMADAYGKTDSRDVDFDAPWAQHLEVGFMVFYSLELLLRLWVYRSGFLTSEEGHWNTLDTLLVVGSWLGFLLATTEAGQKQSKSFLALRGTRIFKMIRLIRVLRSVRFFKPLHLFMDVILGCCRNLFWAVMMIVLVFLLFAIYFVQAMEIQVSISEGDSDESQLINTYFGSVPIALLTLAQTVSGGIDWGDCFSLVARTGTVNAIVFLIMVAFFYVAVWNIVTSVFVENTFRAAVIDREEEAAARHRCDVQDAKDLMKLARQADLDSSGTLSAEEFQSFMDNEQIRTFFAVRGLDIKNAMHFFEMVSAVNAGEEIALEYFVGCCLRVKGPASSIDLHLLAFEHRLMTQRFNRFVGFVETAMDEMFNKLGALKLAVVASKGEEEETDEEEEEEEEDEEDEEDEDTEGKKVEKEKKAAVGADLGGSATVSLVRSQEDFLKSL